jgi:hypothetical protein
MRSMMECLAKAADMDQFAAKCDTPHGRALFLKLALRWRELALRALRQDQWPEMTKSDR